MTHMHLTQCIMRVDMAKMTCWRSNIRMEKKGDLWDFECYKVVRVRRAGLSIF